MSFKEQLKEYFTFTKGESKGITVLLIILFLAIFVNLSSVYFSDKPEYDFSKYENILADTDTIKYFENPGSKYDTLNLCVFNPNELSLSLSKKLGISEYQYNMIRKYLNSGGKFKYKSDFAKIYSISDEQYAYLKPYIDLPEIQFQKTEKNSCVDERNNLKNDYKISCFKFNPNTLNDSGWSELGFSEKQIASIRKYIKSGGIFTKKEDLKKLYVINDKKYAELEPYIDIPENINKNKFEEKHIKVDVNNLSPEEMKKLGKFWQYNASRIVKYRDLLGGYYKKEQILEVYGVKKEYYVKVEDDILIDRSKLEKININFAEVSELAKHPYISYELAKKIINFRNNFGFIKDLRILKEKKIISDGIYEKISSYLTVK